MHYLEKLKALVPHQGQKCTRADQIQNVERVNFCIVRLTIRFFVLHHVNDVARGEDENELHTATHDGRLSHGSSGGECRHHATLHATRHKVTRLVITSVCVCVCV